jgi:hypothetical protein
MAQHSVSLDVGMKIVANEAGEAAINRYVGLAAGNEFGCAPGLTREEVERSLCEVVLRTGRDPEKLDGWADLQPDDLRVFIDDIQEL